MDKSYKREAWFLYLNHSMKDLVEQTFELLAREEAEKKERFHDYSFLLFPIAKAYEGFLKKLLFDLHLITQISRDSIHFRIGRSLNPDLPEKYKNNDWLYGELSDVFERNGCREIAADLWEAWRIGRNKVFHYYMLEHGEFLDLKEAKRRIELICVVMREVLECEVLDTNL